MSSLINFSTKLALLLALLSGAGGCAAGTGTVKSAAIPEGKKPFIVVLPVENLSGVAVPLKSIRQSLAEKMREQGVGVLDEKGTDQFLARHRLRHTGSIDRDTLVALKTETGAAAVLISSMEMSSEAAPPKVAISCRLVSTAPEAKIIGMTSAALAGDDAPGLLGMGEIHKPDHLLEKALDPIAVRLAGAFSGREEKGRKWMRKFRPKTVYHSPSLDMQQQRTIAIIPFINKSGRKSAGEIVALHFVEELAKDNKHIIIEPGVVRQAFLKFRIILEGGISLANADVLFNDLNADLVLTGEVQEFQDYQGGMGTPKVDFSLTLLDRKSREVVWTSHSYNEGDDGVFFFDLGRVNTAGEMTSQMAAAIVSMIGKN
ncbi:lipoprotein, putative [Geotalea daltonii FRC-32]|uniref:Lipoprotein, putative n=1 Tax=Geotalea daltonii (strain DSM 22248 / JCM 15807 / FRC-32) TaxID=316067 RepID=B9M450_GEODF|nr:hypothetical protein [Geotalea daltonii]ACM21505.1 lipoprotein, putative [Geotalea daltonii FRC-32]